MQGEENQEEDPVTPEELNIVERGKGTPEQIKRVRAALSDPNSKISKWLQESEKASQNTYRAWLKRQPSPPNIIVGPTLAHQNYYNVVEYVSRKCKAGVLSNEDFKAIVASTGGEDMTDPEPTPTHYAISVTRMIRTLVKLHPELESEVRALTISAEKNR